MVGQREVVIGTEIYDFPAIRQAYHGLLRGPEPAFGLVETLGPEVLQLGPETVEKYLVHALPSVENGNYRRL
jgi:hypothetical protein